VKLIPHDHDHGWSPFVWLFFLCFFFFHPVLDHVGWREWLVTGLAAVTFLSLFFSIFWLESNWKLAALLGILLLGIGFAPSNHGASIFFIYTASFIPFVTNTFKQALRLWLALLVVIGLEAWLWHLPGDFWLPSYVVAIPVGLSNMYFAQRNRANAKLRMAHGEIEQLAKVAERERIARDLHDVLGHTLSLITLKSELAGKLIDRDPIRARAEIRDVENTARQALADVRLAIGGYRAKGLPEEFKQAKATLETAGLTVDCEAAQVGLEPAHESILALALREAVTNIVRHADAHRCRLSLAQVNGACRLEIQDDGRGGRLVEGNGLRGMRERIEALGGTLQHETSEGTRLTITVPVHAEPSPS
jgi:two-component system, NarL family, sensor histidine kinase DesK